jgi:exopolysaccharide biosynthesis polyprenyl glycosylphosphotransferase
MTRLRRSTLLLLGLDVLAVFAVFNAVSQIRALISAHEDGSGKVSVLWRSFLDLFDIFTRPAEFHTWSLLVPLALVVAALALIDGYRMRTDMLSLDYTSQHILALLAAMTATLLLVFVLISVEFPLQGSRSVVAVGFLLLIPLTLTYRRAIYLQSNVAHRGKHVVFLGDRPSCFAFREECRRNRLAQPVTYATIGDDSGPPFGGDGLGLLPFRDVLQQIQEGNLQVEAIVLRESGRELLPATAEQLVRLYFSGVPTFTLELFHQIYWRKIPLYRLNQIWLFQEGFPIARMPVFERLKRIGDILFASAGLLLAAPFIALAAIAIRLDDRGPVFYRQTRIGRNREPFQIVKLRSMRADSDQGDRYTRQGDKRVTRVGRYLRASRLDELPQLWNVLRGEMSLIGPRAEWDQLVAEYELEIPCYFFRHLVKPGITGWAQVNLPYGTSTEDTGRKLEYDLYYIRHYSFGLDAAIVLKTIHLMLSGRGH